MKLNNTIRPQLATAIRTEIRRRSNMSAMSHILLVSVFFLLLGQDIFRHGFLLLFALTIFSANTLRLLLSKGAALKNEKAWHLKFTLNIFFSSWGWSLLTTGTMHYYGLEHFNSLFALVILTGVISSSLFSIGPSLRDFSVSIFALISMPLLFFILQPAVLKAYFSLPLIIVLFAAFVFKLRDIQYKDWYELFHEKILNETLINSFPGGISLVKDKKYVMVNQNFCDLLGSSRDQVLGAPISKLQLETSFEIAVADFLNSSSESLIKDLKITQGDLTKTHMLFLQKVLGSTDEVVIGTLDIHEMKQAELKLALHRQQLEASSKMAALGEMSSGLAHEINNPLTIIIGRAHQILRVLKSEGAVVNPSVHSSLDGIVKTAERIAKIIVGLRNFARDGTQEPVARVKLKQILDDTFAFCEFRIKNHDILLTVEPYDENLEIECRAIQFGQVLLNIVMNAHDAVEDHSERWIKVKVKTDRKNLQVIIEDSGPPVSSVVREKLMQPFFTTKEVGKGTGLGLSISKGLIEGHGGTILFSFSEKYTQVIITMPLRKVAQEKKAS